MKRRVVEVIFADDSFHASKVLSFLSFNESVPSIGWSLGLGDVDDDAYVEFECRREFQCD